jgi:hypothetical protein
LGGDGEEKRWRREGRERGERGIEMNRGREAKARERKAGEECMCGWKM